MKKHQHIIYSLAVVAALAGCQQESKEASEKQQNAEAATSEVVTNEVEVSKAETVVRKKHNPIDDHTYGNLHEVDLKHLDLDLTVDFEEKSLKGFVDLSFDRLKDNVSELILDTRDIDVSKVELNKNDQWIAGEFELAEKDEVMGSKLTIKLEEGVNKVRVHYATQPQASGLQWLTPEQTDGKKHPFMYSQAQAIHARSFVPVQDSPAVRITYNATIRTPKELLAVMSAFNEPDTALDGEYHFEMPQAIPTYLIAIGVGDLKFKAMSDRTGVYAEPAILDATVAEFDDTEEMVKVTEELYGPYRWGRYDLLILPPAFPYGGMENPRLSFITPTVIAGDKSLVSLIAHELAHSWSGNLVTNANWHDFWLNEGFTSYVENRIMEELFGRERALMEQSLSVQDLRQAVQDLPTEYTVLNVDLKGADPDDAFSTVPYTKGQMFLVWLEEKFGREVFDAFLVNYFDHFAFQSITTQQFETYLKENLLDKHPGVVTDEQIHTWIHEPMLPEMMPNPTSDAFEVVDAKTKQLLSGEITLDQLGTEEWTVHEWLHFINNLPAGLPQDDMMALDAKFKLTESTNNEIAHAWLLLSLKAGYDVVMPRLQDYLISIGRRKLIVPLYKQLMETEQGTEFAKRVYKVARPGYHPLAQATLDEVVK
ncbi:M1 family metallopeptidase [Kangiella aquimarina]|uniref:Aminopeptidase N n=1 Tax=Kangiella aquimarina TaxID=261965 RepID=A0ABZ0X126_9GAMM|nr:M1 family metallopeptidase [Kangiella aquimarina]WQG84287.1 M1 family metallopeptidase [Kangiella aquimarina]